MGAPVLTAVNKTKGNSVFIWYSAAFAAPRSHRAGPRGSVLNTGTPASQRKIQCDGAGPASAASRSDAAACLLSPGEAENIAEGGERQWCVSRTLAVGCEPAIPVLC